MDRSEKAAKLVLQEQVLALELKEIWQGKAAAGIYLFGAGTVGVFLHDFLSRVAKAFAQPSIIKGFLDNSPAAWGQMAHGLPVVTPASLEKENAGAAVLIATEYVESMARQLDGYGLKPRVDYWDGFRLYQRLRRWMHIYGEDNPEAMIPEELVQDIAYLLGKVHGVGSDNSYHSVLDVRKDYRLWQMAHRVTPRLLREMEVEARQWPEEKRVFFTVVCWGKADAARRQAVEASLEQQGHPWQKVLWLEEANLDSLGEFSKTDYVIFLRSAEFLASGAFGLLARKIHETGFSGWLYGDEDVRGENGQRQKPFFKPDWSKYYQQAQNYIGFWGSCFRGDLVREQQSVFSRLLHEDAFAKEGLVLLAHEGGAPAHVPEIVLHRGSARVTGISAMGSKEEFALPIHTSGLTVSILIPTRDRADQLERCLQSLFQKTVGVEFEVLVLDNDSIEEETKDLLALWLEKEPQRFRVWRCDEAFNYARLNNAGARQAHGEYVVLLNNDTEILQTDWLRDLLVYAGKSDVGAVGPMLLYPDDTVQHAGVILGVGAVADHAFRGFAAGDAGYFGRLRAVSEYSAVTGACLVVRKDRYWQAGGMEEELAVSYNDVDFCLKLRGLGLVNLVVPQVRLRHYESQSRGANTTPEKQAQARREEKWMWRRWGQVLPEDPYYSPHLTRASTDFALKMPEEEV
ncbi:glycosyltransferase family 2 protein [Anaeromusa sp.]|uniref:glycosyltransferase family 2 protein n=1 Tax=Anaeromusa sp. TaxID=1872520 RepID=UPI002627F01A|nr:glycosyltransferase family 2 protein [Anaeromusa sp.]MDD3157096.1 glycosyltransferase family 2 protein [Anaeromusa sp.]